MSSSYISFFLVLRLICYLESCSTTHITVLHCQAHHTIIIIAMYLCNAYASFSLSLIASLFLSFLPNRLVPYSSLESWILMVFGKAQGSIQSHNSHQLSYLDRLNVTK